MKRFLRRTRGKIGALLLSVGLSVSGLAAAQDAYILSRDTWTTYRFDAPNMITPIGTLSGTFQTQLNAISPTNNNPDITYLNGWIYGLEGGGYSNNEAKLFRIDPSTGQHDPLYGTNGLLSIQISDTLYPHARIRGVAEGLSSDGTSLYIAFDRNPPGGSASSLVVEVDPATGVQLSPAQDTTTFTSPSGQSTSLNVRDIDGMGQCKDLRVNVNTEDQISAYIHNMGPLSSPIFERWFGVSSTTVTPRFQDIAFSSSNTYFVAGHFGGSSPVNQLHEFQVIAGSASLVASHSIPGGDTGAVAVATLYETDCNPDVVDPNPDNDGGCSDCELCCPPFTQGQFESMYVGGNSTTGGREVLFQSNPTIDNQMESWLAYAKTLNPNIETVNILYIVSRCDQSPPTLTWSGCTPITSVDQQAPNPPFTYNVMTWDSTPGVEENLVSAPYAFPANYSTATSTFNTPFEYNKLYRVWAMPFLRMSDGTHEGFDNDCPIATGDFLFYNSIFMRRGAKSGPPKFGRTTKRELNRTPQGQSILKSLDELLVQKTNDKPISDGTWSTWLNLDRPGGNGDYDTIRGAQERGLGCKSPKAVECRRSRDKLSSSRTGEVVTCDTETGSSCVNRLQPDKRCEDYEMRMLCPN